MYNIIVVEERSSPQGRIRKEESMEDAVNHIIELMIAVFSPIITNVICDWWETQKKESKRKSPLSERQRA